MQQLAESSRIADIESHKRILEIGFDDAFKNRNDPILVEISSARTSRDADLKQEYDENALSLNQILSNKQKTARTIISQFYFYEARRLGLPVSEYSNSLDHELSLDDEQIHGLRTAIRKERRERYEYYQIRIAFILSLVLAAITIANWIGTDHEITQERALWPPQQTHYLLPSLPSSLGLTASQPGNTFPCPSGLLDPHGCIQLSVPP